MIPNGDKEAARLLKEKAERTEKRRAVGYGVPRPDFSHVVKSQPKEIPADVPEEIKQWLKGE